MVSIVLAKQSHHITLKCIGISVRQKKIERNCQCLLSFCVSSLSRLAFRRSIVQKKIQIEKEDLEAESRRKGKNDAERARLIALVEAENERRRASENVCIISFRLITVSAAVSRSRCATDSASAGRRLNQQCIGYSDQLFVFFNRSKRKKHSRLLPSTLSGRPLRRARPSRRLLVTIC